MSVMTMTSRTIHNDIIRDDIIISDNGQSGMMMSGGVWITKMILDMFVKDGQTEITRIKDWDPSC